MRQLGAIAVIIRTGVDTAGVRGGPIRRSFVARAPRRAASTLVSPLACVYMTPRTSIETSLDAARTSAYATRRARYSCEVQRFVWGFLLCSGFTTAQPAIGQNGVVNRASLIPPTLAGGALARGAAITIHGVRFGNAPVVALRSGAVTVPLRVLASEPEKIDAVVPENAPLGIAALVVGQSKPFPVEVAASNPGIFARNHSPVGCYVPVYIKVTPVRASNVVTMAIASGSGSCANGPIPLLDARRIGVAVITRANMLRDNLETTNDETIALFSAKDDGPALSPLLLLPPPGSCTAYTSSFQATAVMPDSVASALIAELPGDGLSAGSQLTISRGNERRTVPGDRGSAGYYRARLGTSRPKTRAAYPLFLEPGDLVLSAPGGMDVGAFRVSFEATAPFEWLGRAELTVVDRGRPLPLRWAGQAKDQWTILLATNVDQITTAIGTCLCTAPVNSDHFEIPAALLANIPASMEIRGIPYDQLFVASIPAKTARPIQAPGLGAGAVMSIYAKGRFVQYH
jgi:hypothetical protein